MKNQHKPSQAHRIAALLDDYRPHCSNEMREMFIADPPRRINDLEEEGYIIKKEYCTMHSYHDGLPKMYTLVGKPSETLKTAPQAAKQPEASRYVHRLDTPPQGPYETKTNAPQGYVYVQPKPKHTPYSYKPPESCCDIAVFCYTKNLPVRHRAGCGTKKTAA